MRCKKGHKTPKKLPYGATKGKFWCWGCDADLVSSWTKPIKKRERQKAKKKIKDDLSR
jgi:hypothetical protein